MRPHILTISAFGPYGGEVILDFNALEDARIFLITGSTGSGKSFLFDAMFYALYGTLGQNDRSNMALRSDFTPPEEERRTFVHLEFFLGERRYRIERYPAQEVPYKYKEGYRLQSASVAFYDLQNPSLAPLTNSGEVQQKIEELIGLTADQFKKIVMIPQGSFQEFLLAKTQEKQGILRHIFGTELYLRAQKLLAERASQIQASFKEKSRAFRIHLDHLSWGEERGVVEAGYQEMQQQVAEEINKDRLLLGEWRKERLELEAQGKRASASFQAAEKHNEVMQEWQVVETKLLSLEKEKQAMVKIQQRLSLAQAAKEAVAKENYALEHSKQVEEAMKHLLKLKEETILSETVYQACQRTYARLEEQADTMQDLEESFQVRRQQLKDIEDLEALQKKHQETMERYTALGKTHEAYRLEAEKAEKNKECIENRLKDIRRVLDLEAARAVEKMTLEGEIGDLRSALILLEKQKKDAIDLSQAKGELDKQREAEEKAHSAWRNGQKIEREQGAYSLATQLVEGEPCPVCGATSHPVPAICIDPKHEVDVAALEGEWIAAQALRQKAEQSLLKIKGDYDARILQLKDMGQVIPAEPISWESLIEDLVKKGKEKKADYLKYEKELQGFKALREEGSVREKELEEVRKKMETLQGDLEISRESLERIRIDMKTLEQEIQRLRKGLPEEIFDLGAMRQALEADEAKTKAYQKNFKETQERCNQAKLELTQKKTARDSAQTHYENTEKLAQGRWKEFEAERLKHFAEMEQYQVAREDISEIEILEKKLRNWNDELRLYQNQKDKFVKEYEKLAFRDTESLRQELIALEEKAKMRRDEEVRLAAQLKEQEGVHLKLKTLADECDALEEEYKLHNQCANTFRGENPLRMDMETYVLVHYFEKVLAAANMRLHQMSVGRYSFQRRREVEDRRKYAGLELNVMDYYTGKARDVSTLSGGERFKASLSLALGLSDVVGAESGGIRLSTMFIDEGFGTLDADSLDQTLDTLIELQSHGRLVGIISHVSELKERIPAQLVVEQTPEGSQAFFEVRG